MPFQSSFETRPLKVKWSNDKLLVVFIGFEGLIISDYGPDHIQVFGNGSGATFWEVFPTPDNITPPGQEDWVIAAFNNFFHLDASYPPSGDGRTPIDHTGKVTSDMKKNYFAWAYETPRASAPIQPDLSEDAEIATRYFDYIPSTTPEPRPGTDGTYDPNVAGTYGIAVFNISMLERHLRGNLPPGQKLTGSIDGETYFQGSDVRARIMIAPVSGLTSLSIGSINNSPVLVMNSLTGEKPVLYWGDKYDSGLIQSEAGTDGTGEPHLNMEIDPTISWSDYKVTYDVSITHDL